MVFIALPPAGGNTGRYAPDTRRPVGFGR